MAEGGGGKAVLRKGKTIEQIYQKKSQLEHILLRPDTYVGSIEMQQDKWWVYDESTKKMVQRDVKYVPGLFKIFDEILVNAADNFQRDPKNMTYIKVTINQAEGWVSIENNGQTLPVDIHKEHKMHVPEMVFGHLLTSDNYDDGDEKVTGGRNGYGAKLTNIFSTKFIVECGDKKRKKLYRQVWENNMGTKGKPTIDKYDSGLDYTKVTFYPDFKRFGMSGLDDDIVLLMKKRAFDAAGSTNKKCTVFLNGEPLPITEFKQYVDLYFDNPEEQPKVYDKCGDRWEYVISLSEGQFQQASFVNSINTIKGGTHVTHVADQFVEAIQTKVNKQNKGGIDIRPHHVKSHLWVFVNVLVVNPAFDSQTKETMTLKQSKFGSKCEVSDAAIKKVLNMGIVDTVLQWAKAKEGIDMKKKMKASGKASRIYGIPKLEDANWAGGKQAEECTLILTEGDSAKALAVAGLSVVGRDKYGVFPLRGKPLNIREASYQQTINNAEIQNVITIMGLEQKKVYDSVKPLRYGSIMIMADQDYDGSHIKGLLINMIQHWWPSLFRMEGFVKEFITPIVKVTKGPSVTSFYAMSDYEKWQAETQGGRGWTIKYYKGLGTSTSKEGKEYFRAIADHRMTFRWTGKQDDEAVDLAFNKKRADDRKEWMNAYNEGDTVDHTQKQVGYSDFINKELVVFSRYDVMRAIPCVVDGFKPSQRKVMFACFKRNLTKDIKVAQLAGYIAEHSAYHHGEASMQGTLTAMAQSFVGSNNINLLYPSGQFGTRLMGGKDAASPRYIFTRLERIARVLFHPDDDPILHSQVEEGQTIEPKWYIPVIPMVLVNGAEGIGTGWSTSLPNYNPREIVAQLKKFIKKQPFGDELVPWYRGFKGTIKFMEDGDIKKYECCGIAVRDTNKIEITELPVNKWTQDYKEFLSTLVSTENDKEPRADDFKEYHTENNVHFVLQGTAAQMKAIESDGFEKVLKLRTSLSVNNIVFFDSEGKIKKYANVKEIMQEFAELRLKYYQKRKDYHTDKLRREKELLDAKVKFILMVISGEINVSNRKRVDLVAELQKHGFKPLGLITGKKTDGVGDEIEPPAAKENDRASASSSKAAPKVTGKSGYDYLLGMAIWSLTHEKVEEMKRQMKEKTHELQTLMGTTIETMWERDLDDVLAELDAMDEAEEELKQEEQRLKTGKRKAKAKTKTRRKKSGGKDDDAMDEDEEEEEEEEAPAPKVAKKAKADESVADLLARLKDKQKTRSKMAFES